MIKIEAVHLGPNDVIVGLLRDRPGAGINGGEARLVAGQGLVLCGHGRRRVVGHAVHQWRTLKTPPLGEEQHEILVAHVACDLGSRLICRCSTRTAGLRRAATAGLKPDQHEGREEGWGRQAESRHYRYSAHDSDSPMTTMRLDALRVKGIESIP